MKEVNCTLIIETTLTLDQIADIKETIYQLEKVVDVMSFKIQDEGGSIFYEKC